MSILVKMAIFLVNFDTNLPRKNQPKICLAIFRKELLNTISEPKIITIEQYLIPNLPHLA